MKYSNIRVAADEFFRIAAIAIKISGLDKQSYVKKEKGKYCVKSEHNPDWSGGCYETKTEANKRLEQVEAAKHAKASSSSIGGLALRIMQLSAIQPKLKKPAKPLNNPYKTDDEARKNLETKPIPKKPPSVPPPPAKNSRNKNDPEYKDVDTFANSLFDNDESTFDHEDLQNLNFRTRTPIRELKDELFGYGLTQVERRPYKKPRGINDNPNGTNPFAGNSGGAAFDSVMQSKYNINPFTGD